MNYINKIFRLAGAGLIFLLMLCVQSVEAGQKLGALQSDDFGYRGVCLFDTADKLSAWKEEPLFDTDMAYGELRVKRYTYDKDITVYVSEADNKIIEIYLSGKKYKLREGVGLGSLKYKLISTYGNYTSMLVNGTPCYVFESLDFPDRHLVVELDSENFYLTGVRLTTLPVEEDRPFVPYTPPEDDPNDWDKEYHGVRYTFNVKK